MICNTSYVLNLIYLTHVRHISNDCYTQLHNPEIEHTGDSKSNIVFGGRFTNTYELLNLRALRYSHVNKIHIFQIMGEIFCVEF